MHAVEVRGAYKYYGKAKDPKIVLNRLNMTVDPGSMWVVNSLSHWVNVALTKCSLLLNLSCPALYVAMVWWERQAAERRRFSHVSLEWFRWTVDTSEHSDTRQRQMRFKRLARESVRLFRLKLESLT